jgi:hypothetical protein
MQLSSKLESVFSDSFLFKHGIGLVRQSCGLCILCCLTILLKTLKFRKSAG